MPRRVDEVVTRAIGGETVLVPVRSRVADLDHVYTLSSVASFIWGTIDGVKPVRGLVDEVCREFDVERKVAEQDLDELVDDLLEAGLITMEQP